MNFQSNSDEILHHLEKNQGKKSALQLYFVKKTARNFISKNSDSPHFCKKIRLVFRKRDLYKHRSFKFGLKI